MRQKDVNWLAEVWGKEAEHLPNDERLGFGSAIAVVATQADYNADPKHPLDTSRLRALATEMGWPT